MPQTEQERPVETRQVVVNDPAFGASMNARLTEELQEVVGATEVEVPADRPRLSQGDRHAFSPLRFATNGWLMATIGLFAGVVVAGIVVTASTNSYWWLGLSLYTDILGIGAIVTVVIRLTSITERPESTLFAAMQAEGVSNPEQHFTDLVQEFAQPRTEDGEHRTVTVEDDHAAAAAEQSSSVTPTGGTSRAVGPGS